MMSGGQAAAQSSGVCSLPPITIQHGQTFTPKPVQIIALSAYPNAICNDGSVAKYAIEPGSTLNGNRWIIELEGGGRCQDQTSCNNRRYQDTHTSSGSPKLPEFTGSEGLPKSMTSIGQGYTSHSKTNNPDFYDATHVGIYYCSSDFWTGDHLAAAPFVLTSPDNPVANWNFLGREIIASVIQDLIANHGFGNAKEVVLTGGSAGAAGAIVNVNDVKQMLGPSTRYVTSSDAGYILNRPSFDSTQPSPYLSAAVPTAEQASLVSGMSIWGGRGDANCTAALGNVVSCYDAETVLRDGYISVPMFIHQTQQDYIQMESNGVTYAKGNPSDPKEDPVGAPKNPDAPTYIQWYASQMRKSLAQVYPTHSVFSEDNDLHVELSNSDYTTNADTFGTTSVTLQQAMHIWYQDPCSTRRLLIQRTPTN